MIDRILILITTFGILYAGDAIIDRLQAGRYAITVVWAASILFNAMILWRTIRPPKPAPRKTP